MTKTLVIILAETRAHELTYNNIKENLIDKLNADLCVCIGVKSDYDYSNPFYQNAKYRFLYEEQGSFNEAFDLMCDNKQWRDFFSIDEQFMGGVVDDERTYSGSAGILVFFRWFLLQKLRENDLINQYDRFVITRSDYLFQVPHAELSMLDENNIWIPDEEYYGGYTDRHAVLSKQNIEGYLDIMHSFLNDSENYLSNLKSSSVNNLETLIKFHLLYKQIPVKMFPYVMYTVRPVDGTTRWALGSWSDEHGYYIKYQNEYKKAMLYKLLFESIHKNKKEFYSFYFHL